MYGLIKSAHIFFAAGSISFFLVRAWWSIRELPILHKGWVRVTPHINDSLLLACAVYLMIASGQYPFVSNWLTAKLFALIAYIVLGTIAIKRGKNPQIRLVASALALVVFAYIVAVAISHQPLPGS